MSVACRLAILACLVAGSAALAQQPAPFAQGDPAQVVGNQGDVGPLKLGLGATR
jgi:hypothetical protein